MLKRAWHCIRLKRRFPLQQGLRLYVSITEEVVESVRDHFHREFWLRHGIAQASLALLT